MSITDNKQFGVWMDNHKASIAGREGSNDAYKLLGHESSEGGRSNSNENSANNDEKTQLHKFFKSILAHMPNAEHLHLTGTGTVQEQFKHYMAETPQYKNTKVKDSTAETMSDEKLLEYFGSH
jgi:stalled ribosome rescue protein Dom34